MCKAAKVTIAEVEEIVDLDVIAPEDIHVPSVYVHRVVLGKDYQKRIEVCALRQANLFLNCSKTDSLETNCSEVVE
jgi:hypothetical protein